MLANLDALRAGIACGEKQTLFCRAREPELDLCDDDDGSSMSEPLELPSAASASSAGVSSSSFARFAALAASSDDERFDRASFDLSQRIVLMHSGLF